MSRYLLTPSLHDNWVWYHRMATKEKQDFLNSLLKIQPTDPEQLERMEAGKIFESDIHALSTRNHIRQGIDQTSDHFRCVKEIAELVQGGVWQQKVMFDVTFFGMDFLVYGKIDVRKRDRIFDIKKTGSYEMGKYTGSVQHPTYMVGEKCKKFTYLACDGETVFREDYALDADMERQMFADYEELVDGILADADFKRAYLENWKAYGDREGPVLNDPARFLAAG